MDASVITQVPQGSQQSPQAASTELNNQDEAQQSNKKKGEPRITLQFMITTKFAKGLLKVGLILYPSLWEYT